MTSHADRPTGPLRPPECQPDRARNAVRRLLEHDRRREVTRYLLERGGPVTVGALVARVAASEDEPTLPTPIHALRQRIHVSLRRTHLPLLERHGVLAYDRTRGRVAPAATLPVVAAVLEDERASGTRP